MTFLKDYKAFMTWFKLLVINTLGIQQFAEAMAHRLFYHTNKYDVSFAPNGHTKHSFYSIDAQ